jgi:hypothetical protein
MAVMADPSPTPVDEGFCSERAELEAVLRSATFVRAPILVQILKYICECYFRGESDQIKEYNIAVEALGRPPDFDVTRNSVVRVEAYRLRKRLDEYYRGEGSERPLRITVLPGSYTPQFISSSKEPEPVLDNEAGITDGNLTEGPEWTICAEENPATAALPEALNPALPERGRYGRWARTYLICGAGLLVLAIAFAAWRLSPWQRHAASVAPPTQGNAPVVIDPTNEVRILAGVEGNGVTDSFGKSWGPDRFYRGGEAQALKPGRVAFARDATFYQYRRYAQHSAGFSYDIPLRPGTYELRLYFVETFLGEEGDSGGGEGSRLFEVRANGQNLLRNFDVISDAGGDFTSDIKVFKDIEPASDGLLHLDFVAVRDRPFVNAIEILPTQRGAIRPIRIMARDYFGFTDEKRQGWIPDRYYRGGRLDRLRELQGVEDAPLYRSQRYGNFTYAIPVAENGRYTLRLRFCERQFGPGRSGGGGEGSRIFDVLLNGRTLLGNFDVYKEAGSAHPLIRTFRGLKPNAQGKLILSFIPVRDYAMVNAIEVIDEAWK